MLLCSLLVHSALMCLCVALFINCSFSRHVFVCCNVHYLFIRPSCVRMLLCYLLVHSAVVCLCVALFITCSFSLHVFCMLLCLLLVLEAIIYLSVLLPSLFIHSAILCFICCFLFVFFRAGRFRSVLPGLHFLPKLQRRQTEYQMYTSCCSR